MIEALVRHIPFLPRWHWSTGANLAVATPKWRDLARRAPDAEGENGWDLVRDERAVRDAGARLMHLFGQVIDFDGNPMPDVTVEVWQDGPCEAGYAGHGAVRTDRFGGYRFRTILPIGVDGAPPHIDARLTPARGRVLGTRLYLLDDPRNEKDWHFAALGPSRQAAVTLDPVARADGELEAGFNFVL